MKDSIKKILPDRGFHWILLVALSLTCGTLYGLSSNVVEGGGSFTVSAWLLPLICLFESVPFLCVFVCLDALYLVAETRFSLRRGKESGDSDPCLEGSGMGRWGIRARSVAVRALMLLVFWLPWLVALYPGSMNWDTYYQITQCYLGEYPVWLVPYAPTDSLVDAWFSDHHPLFDTLLYGAFARVSDVLFGTWNYGVFLYVLVQSFFLAFSLVYFLAYVRSVWGVRRSHILILFCFFALFPLYPAYAGSMMKDSTNLIPLLFWLICVAEIARSKGSCLSSKRFLVFMVLMGVLVALTKKIGLYVVVLTLLILVFFYRKKAAPLLAGAFAPAVIVSLLIPSLVFPALNVVPGGRQEMLGPLFQQTARYVLDHPDEVSSEDMRIIDDVLDYETLASRYDYWCSDPVKFMYNQDAEGRSLGAYLKVWAFQGLNHPTSYLEATFSTVGSFYADGSLSPLWDTGDAAHSGSDLLHKPEGIAMIRDFFRAVYDGVSSMPIVNILFLSSFWTLVLPGGVVYIALRRGREELLPVLLPTLIFVGFCLISPVYDTRYILPVLAAMPMTVLLLFSNAARRRS